jgi:molybdopterin-guanine dinucleotide biosynthesis protein B
VDIVLAEGYRGEEKPKIEVVRAAQSSEPICELDELLALVTDLSLSLAVPQFDLDDAVGLVDLIVARFLVS